MRSETRHQLKQDRFSRATIGAAEATVHWSAEHRSRLIVGIVAALVIVAAALGGWYYLGVQDEKASLEMSQAIRTLNTPLAAAGTPAQPDLPTFPSAQERATAARKQFQAVADKYSHTRSADFARYFVGVTSVQLGDNAAAEREFGAVASLRNQDVASLAKLALASVYRSTNRDKQAIEIYKALADKPTTTVGKSAAQIQLAETYLAAQQPLEAKRIYEQVQKENPSTDAAQIANARLQEIK